jgi:hypothetical protein
VLHGQMAKVELERLSGNSYARAKRLTMSRVIAA